MFRVEWHRFVEGFVILKYLVVVRCEGEGGSHINLYDAIFSRTHPEGDVRGGHGVNGSRWRNPRYDGETVIREGVLSVFAIFFRVPTCFLPAFFGISIIFTGDGDSLELELFLSVSFFVIVIFGVCDTQVLGVLDPCHAGMTGKSLEGVQGDDGLLTDGARPINIVGL